jgi:hypothetical protein
VALFFLSRRAAADERNLTARFGKIHDWRRFMIASKTPLADITPPVDTWLTLPIRSSEIFET